MGLEDTTFTVVERLMPLGHLKADFFTEEGFCFGQIQLLV
jgi:hypothetical protein